MSKEKNQVILLTGASRGIGSAMFQILKENNFKVYGTSRSGLTPERFIKEKNNDKLIKLDLNDFEEIESVVEFILSLEKRIDVLINNAGFGLCGPLLDTSMEEIQEQFNTNLFGIHYLIKKIYPTMEKQSSGKIINIGSFGGRVSIPYQAMYSASKAALAMYTDSLRIENNNSDIQITLIEPGDVRTNFHYGRRYTKNFDNNETAIKAVDSMHKLEQKGSDSARLGKLVLKLIGKNKLKPRYLFGFDAKIFNILLRCLPYRAREKVIKMLYHV